MGRFEVRTDTGIAGFTAGSTAGRFIYEEPYAPFHVSEAPKSG